MRDSLFYNLGDRLSCECFIAYAVISSTRFIHLVYLHMAHYQPCNTMQYSHHLLYYSQFDYVRPLFNPASQMHCPTQRRHPFLDNGTCVFFFLADGSHQTSVTVKCLTPIVASLSAMSCLSGIWGSAFQVHWVLTLACESHDLANLALVDGVGNLVAIQMRDPGSGLVVLSYWIQ